MSTYVDAVIILSCQTPATDVLRKLTKYLEESGAVFQSDTSVIFNDFDGEEKEPESVPSKEQASHSITSWPGLGGTAYTVLDYKVVVFLHGVQAYQVDFVTLSIGDHIYSSNTMVREAFDRMSEGLHLLLGAKRTISGFELLSPNSWVADEVKRVRCGVFDGHYSRDLRSSQNVEPI